MISLYKTLAGGILCLFLIGCSPSLEQQPPIITTVRQATLQGDRPPDIPKEQAILTVSGKIHNTNQGQSLSLDRPTLEQLAIFQYEIFDIFEQQMVTFEGVLLNDLFDLCQIEPDATGISVTALNNYKIELPLAKARNLNILFALKQNGDYMDRDYRGPAMFIVPPFKQDLELNTRNSLWIWQVSSIEVY